MQADQVFTDEQRSRADGEHRHGWGAVKRRHRRIAVVPASDLGVPNPMRGGGQGQRDQQRGGQHPDTQRERVQRRRVDGQQDRGVGEDAGPHDRRIPVGSEMAKDIAWVSSSPSSPRARTRACGAGSRMADGGPGVFVIVVALLMQLMLAPVAAVNHSDQAAFNSGSEW